MLFDSGRVGMMAYADLMPSWERHRDVAHVTYGRFKIGMSPAPPHEITAPVNVLE